MDYNYWETESRSWGDNGDDDVVHWIVMIKHEDKDTFLDACERQQLQCKHIQLERQLLIYTIDTTKRELEKLSSITHIMKICEDASSPVKNSSTQKVVTKPDVPVRKWWCALL